MQRKPQAMAEPVEGGSTAELTRCLAAWNEGDQSAFDRVSSRLYAELRVIARSHLRREHRAPLQTTELIHESFLRLADQRHVEWQNRGHFFGIASRMMRRILVDEARRTRADKRGSGLEHASLDGLPHDSLPQVGAEEAREILDVHEALGELAQLDPDQARIVEMRFFGGFETTEVADALGLSVSTVFRQWRVARAWLHRRLKVAAP